MDPVHDAHATVDGRSIRQISISDVGMAADVTVSAVSPVLNQPHLVGVETRKLVTGVMEASDYVPKENTVAERCCRLETPSSNLQQKVELRGDAACESRDRSRSLPAEGQLSPPWEKLRPGDRLRVSRSGYPEGEAIIDSMMPDFSALWLRMFNGMGRFIVLPEDDVRFELVGRGEADV
jgi:uncharacterized protein (DUF3084 family)